MNRPFRTIAALAATGAAGILVSLTLVASAFAWSPTSLPPGWTVDHLISSGSASCPSAYRIRTTASNVFSDPLCEDSPTYQHDFDAFVDAHYTAPVTTTAPTTTVPAAPVPTTTTTAVDPAPAPGPVETTPVTTTPVTTTPVTTTPVTTTPTCDLQCQIVDLQAQLDELRSQLAQLVQILRAWPSLDPGILAQLMALG